MFKNKIVFTEKEIPSDIQEYFQIMAITGGMMGLEMYQRCKAIIENNPTWFPWEHKYKSIPQEVHDAYLDEKNSDRHEPLSFTAMGSSNGIIPDIMSKGTVFNYPPKESLSELWQQILEADAKYKKDVLERDKKEKALWDKHYKKYKLEWRKN